MLIQLVASERGVAALPDWVVAEYEKKGWVVSRKLGDGVGCQLYAATRTASKDIAYMQGFASLLAGIVKPVEYSHCLLHFLIMIYRSLLLSYVMIGAVENDGSLVRT